MNGMTMKTLVAMLVALVVPAAVWAIEFPHETGSVKGYVCNSCHSTHNTLGSTGFNNVCQTCHKPGDAYGHKKPFRDADFANPFGTFTSARPGVIYQTSHNWVGKDRVPRAGALPPTNTALSKNIVAGTIVCARCHAIHYVYSSANNTKPFLRVRNENDQMCLDCHRPRSTTNHTLGTHPVTMNYAEKAAARPDEFYATPQNSNPANPTSAMKMSRSGAVVCTTCHGVHYTDSNSRTFDNASSARMGLLSTSRGLLLRTDLRGATVTDRNICTNCHKSADDPANTMARVKSHNGTKNQNVQCADCHGGHVDEADGTIPNAYLINRFMNISTQYGAVRNAKVLYQYTSVAQKNYNKDSFGVCVACHPTLPATISTHLTSTNAADCRSCHSHAQGFSANCTQCHGFPPQANTAGGTSGYAKDGARDYSTSGVFKDESATPHVSHAGGGSYYSFACDECHKGFNHNAGSFQDVFLTPAGTRAAGNGATPAYNGTGSGTCTTTYCHSDGNGVYTSPTWAGGKDDIMALAGAARCGSCHSATPATGAHGRHISGGATGKGYGCVNCHASTVSDNTTLLAAARTSSGTHVNAVKDKQFSGSVGAVNLSGSTCSTVYCHSNGKGGAPVVAPVWGNPASGQCGACHRAIGADPINTAGHLAHLSAAYGPQFGTAANACSNCHTYTDELAATHVDGTIQVVAANCTTSCHKHDASEFVWTGGRVTCESCHTAPLSVIGGRTAPAKANFTSSGHGQAFSNYSSSKRCSSCHDATSGHIDGISGNQKRVAVNDNTLCAGCHNDAAKVPTVARRNVTTHVIAKDGTPAMDCKVCHDVHGTGNRGMIRAFITFGAFTSTITYATTGDLVQLVPPYRGVCQSCHTATSHYRRGVAEGANHPTSGCLNCHSHKNTYAFKPKACDECHGYPPAPKGFVASQATYSSARLENYSGGGGAHVKLGHLMANIRPSQGFTPCLACHNDGPAAHMGDDTVWSGGTTQTKKAPVSVKVDPTYKFNATKGQWYKQQAPDATGSCWNVSCHFQPTPRWSNDK